MSGTEPQTEAEPVPAALHALFWTAAYLVELAWGGHEEGGWHYEEATLVTDPGIYAGLAVLPACSLTEAEAEAVAARMRAGLGVLNKGRRPLRSVLSTGLYDVRVTEGATLPSCLPVSRPHYE